MTSENQNAAPIDFAADAPEKATGAADQLARVGMMADQLTAAQIAVAEAEIKLDSAEKNLREITREEFPTLLKEVGLKEVQLTDKRKIVLSEEIDCGITEENRPDAHGWLRANAFGGLIKSAVIVGFDKGEDEEMALLLKAIAAHLKARVLANPNFAPRVAEVKEGVHWQTLKSFIKEQRAKAGQPNVPKLPEELFGVFPYDKVDVVFPKGAVGFKLKRIYAKKS